ncbi:MAG: dihydrofolate reductase family protein [Pyrinomonadaceae bacterium]
MRKVILCLAVSFDGFIEGPNGEIDWIVFDQDAGSALSVFIKEIDTILYGRISYEKWSSPPPSDDGSDFAEFSRKQSEMDNYVFSRSKDKFEGNPIVVNSDIPELIQKLKQQRGKHIWLYGGANLITTFMNLNLIDEFRIAVIPVILGQGKPLFQDIQNPLKLKLIEVKESKSGVLAIRYNAVK